jgi:hypothetical protein
MNATGNQSRPAHHTGRDNPFYGLPSDFRPPTSTHCPPGLLWSGNSRAKQKITKRTHFGFFNLPINTGDFPPSVSNLPQKRTHLSQITHHKKPDRSWSPTAKFPVSAFRVPSSKSANLFHPCISVLFILVFAYWSDKMMSASRRQNSRLLRPRCAEVQERENPFYQKRSGAQTSAASYVL